MKSKIGNGSDAAGKKTIEALSDTALTAVCLQAMGDLQIPGPMVRLNLGRFDSLAKLPVQ